MRFPLFLLLALAMIPTSASAAEPVRVAILRLTHDHVFWLLGRPKQTNDIQIVGIYEPNAALAAERAEQFGIDPKLLFTDLDQLFETARPEAACLFGSIREHHPHTLACAERGVHVMVEKPLAMTLAEGQAMADATKRAGVTLLTNYETTGYANLHALKRQIDSDALGDVRRLVFRIGHRGPVEIGCRKVFLDWLLDPAENGGGAITDFGCYGVNLTTWLLGGERPTSVLGVTRHLKPNIYPHVDDDATMILNYADSVAVVQASWNWPDSVKQTTVYCERGWLQTSEGDRLAVRIGDGAEEQQRDLVQTPPTFSDPFRHLANVVQGKEQPNPLAALENNLLVMEILDAARRSAESGELVVLP